MAVPARDRDASTPRDHQSDDADATRVMSHRVEQARPGRPGVDPSLVVAVVAGVIALFTLVVGIVTLARTGLPLEGFADATTTVGPFQRGALMGLVEIVVGIAAGGIAASRRASSLTAFGLFALVFGLVWLIEPNAFSDILGIGRATAWTYLLFGVVSAGVGLWAPDTAERVVIRT